MNLIKISGNDDNFESSFFQLAYDQLQDKLRNLLPYLVGFELVKKSDDGAKALGVFGFRSQSGQILYVPAFFVNGVVRGLDLLYNKNNEQFYPLTEDFAELFLKDDVTSVGQESDIDRNQINKNQPPMQLRDLVTPPRTGKYSIASVLDYVEDAGDVTKAAFTSMLEKDAEYFESVLRFYPMDKIAKAITPKKKKDVKKESIVEVVKLDSAKAKDLPAEGKKDLLTQGFTIVDRRKNEQKSRFGAFKFTEKFGTPGETGFYPYITAVGTLRFGMVFLRPKQLQQRFSTDDAIVVDLDSESRSNAYVVDVNKLVVKDQIVIKDYSDVIKRLEAPAESTPSFSTVYMLVNEKLEAVQPFRIVANFKDAQGIRRLSVEPYRCHCHANKKHIGESRPGSIHDLPEGNYYEHPVRAKQITLVLTKSSSNNLTYKDGMVYVPTGWKLLKLNFDSYGFPGEGEDREKHENRFREGKPGTLTDLNANLTERGVFPLTVSSSGSEYFVSLKDYKKNYKDAQSVKIAMVTEYGMDFKAACELIDGVTDFVPTKGYIKMAYTGDYSPSIEDEVPYANELGQPTYTGVGRQQVMPTDQSYTDDPTALGRGTMGEVGGGAQATGNEEDFQQDTSKANQLASMGQKEIFDTQSIATLAKYVSTEDKVNSYIPKLLDALDCLGRMLFLLHWEVEKFNEMYGKTDMPELSDLLTSVFKNLGELVIFFKRKSPELSINKTEQDVLDA